MVQSKDSHDLNSRRTFGSCRVEATTDYSISPSEILNPTNGSRTCCLIYRIYN